jgi:hypothetical protein
MAPPTSGSFFRHIECLDKEEEVEIDADAVTIAVWVQDWSGRDAGAAQGDASCGWGQDKLGRVKRLAG